MKKRGKMKTLLLVLSICVLAASMTMTSFAATSTEWTTNAGREALIRQTSNTEFEVIGTASQPTEIFSYDSEVTNIKSDISTTDISFKINISNPGADHGDFYAIFVVRIADPSSGIWGPSNSGISLQFNKGSMELRRWTKGMVDTEKVQVLQKDFVDGNTHDINIKIDGNTVTATADGESISATYAFVPSMGGYQAMAYNATVKISEFDDGTTPSAGTQTPSTGTETPSTGTETPSTETETPSTETETPSTVTDETLTDIEDTDDYNEEDVTDVEKESGNTTYIIIAAVVVLLCVAGGLAYYFLIFKKK